MAREGRPLIEGILSAAERNLFSHAALLNALDLRLHGAEIVVTGKDADRLTQAALKLPFAGRIVLRAASATDLPASHPAQEKLKSAPDSAAFICVGERCSLPVTSADAIARCDRVYARLKVYLDLATVTLRITVRHSPRGQQPGDFQCVPCSPLWRP